MLELRRLLGPGWRDIQDRVHTLLEQLPTRRKDYVYQLIDNNIVISFAQLASETELSEPDLEAVLEELEDQDKKIRRLGGAAGDGSRSQAHFKVQDFQKPEKFKALLAKFKESAPPRKKYPEFMWQLVSLCSSLLTDDGFHIESDLDEYRPYFEDPLLDQSEEHLYEQSDDATELTLVVNDREIRAASVRELLVRVWSEIHAQKIDVSGSIPFFIGRTRYLVNWQPAHDNGAPFAVPIHVDDVYFEGNLTRAQALNEILRFLTQAGAEALSSNVEVEYGDAGESEEPVASMAYDVEERRLGVELHRDAGGQSIAIAGATVREFYTHLLSYLLDNGYDLSSIVPLEVGRVRYLIAEEPYHRNGRRFQAIVSKDGYFMEASHTHAQAMANAVELCAKLGLQASSISGDERTPLRLEIGDRTVEGSDVPEFFTAALQAMYGQGLLTEQDIPYKSGRIRYFISATPTHDHGRDFIRPIEVQLGANRYYVEANMSRNGALELVQKLLASKVADPEPEGPAPGADPPDI